MTPEQKVKHLASQRKYWAKNREKLAKKKNKHYHKFRDKYLTIERERSYRKLYGIGVSDYERLLEKQEGKCSICKSVKAGNKGQHFAIDHCHATGRIRGLLCVRCNVAVGFYKKHHSLIAKYLEDA